MKHPHPLYKSFVFAFEGIFGVLKREKNFKIQVSFGILAIIVGVILKIELTDWVVLTLVISTVLVLELANTALEALIDMVSPEIQSKAKIAKDVAAGAVLVSSIASVIIGTLIFLPKIF